MMNQETEQLMPGIEPAEVTSALHAILSTDKFSASPQMSAFLRYVVEQTLIGNTRRIKAFTVGIEALGKPASFDPQTDPSVRVLAKRLRSSLDTYYVQNPDTTVFIEMKPGSYIPKFLLRSEMNTSSDTADSTAMDSDSIRQDSTPSQQPVVATAEQSESASPTSEQPATNQPTGINQLWQAYKSASKVA